MLQILLPAWTVCLDLFFTAIAYGISGIRIPVRAACIPVSYTHLTLPTN